MKILYDIATAFKIGKECIDSINNIPNFKEGTPWKISVESLKNTLNYIYEELPLINTHRIYKVIDEILFIKISHSLKFTLNDLHHILRHVTSLFKN